jgi:hypothetical protein
MRESCPVRFIAQLDQADEAAGNRGLSLSASVSVVESFPVVNLLG